MNILIHIDNNSSMENWKILKCFNHLLIINELSYSTVQMYLIFIYKNHMTYVHENIHKNISHVNISFLFNLI